MIGDLPAVPEITVILPTHNPRRAVLARVLAALREQTLPRDRWQAVLVDNGSPAPIEASDLEKSLPGLVVVREPRLGLTFARLAGIAAARGPLVVFVDDDNVFAPDYLERAAAFMRAHPEVGVCGGRIVGEFSSPPPEWARPHLGLLALRDHGPQALISRHPAGPIKEYDYFAPLGAGMVVRTDIAREYAGWVGATPDHLVGRSGSSLASAEECELVLRALSAGKQLAYSPELTVTHVIPDGRLTFGYLVRMNRVSSQSWTEFQTRHGLLATIPGWSVPLRQAKAFFTAKAWTRSGYIRWRGLCGYFAGQTA